MKPLEEENLWTRTVHDHIWDGYGVVSSGTALHWQICVYFTYGHSQLL